MKESYKYMVPIAYENQNITENKEKIIFLHKHKARWDLVAILLIIITGQGLQSDGIPPNVSNNTYEHEYLNSEHQYINEAQHLSNDTQFNSQTPIPYESTENDESYFSETVKEWENNYEQHANKPAQPETVNSRVEAASVSPRQVYYTGGAVGYPFSSFNLYEVFTAPFHATQIILESGEQIRGDIIIGDSNNYEVVASYVIGEEGQRPHIFIKPSFPGRKTNMVINTTRRTYNLTIRSFEVTWMPIVYFLYSDNLIANDGDEEIIIQANLSELDYNYEILALSPHAPAFRPSIVFTDNVRTFLQFPSATKATKAPTLFSINKNTRQLLNYRVVEDYYIVDGVQNHMELVLDTNLDNIIVIKRKNRR